MSFNRKIKDWPEEKEYVEWSCYILVFFVAQKFCSFIKLRLNQLMSHGLFNDVLTTFLGLEHGSCVGV